MSSVSNVQVLFSRDKNTGSYSVTYRAYFTIDQDHGGFLVSGPGVGYNNRTLGPFGTGWQNISGPSGTSWGELSASYYRYLRHRWQVGTGGQWQYADVTGITWSGSSPAFTFDVEFDHNNGTGDTTTETQTAEQPWVFPSDPVKSGYSFAGWYTEAEGGTKIEPGTVFSGADHQNITTLYAHWDAMSILHLVENGEAKTITEIWAADSGETKKIIGVYAVVNGEVHQGV